MTYTLKVSSHPSNDTQKHVELLRDGVTVMADFYDLPISLGAIGEELMARYSPPSGIYNLDGTPHEQPKDEYVYPEETVFPSGT